MLEDIFDGLEVIFDEKLEVIFDDGVISSTGSFIWVFY
jgi:hypothetical protein